MSNETVLQLDPSPRNRRNSEGAFITLQSGRILLVLARFEGSNKDHGHAYLASRYSDDGGKTWSRKDRIIVPRGAARNVMSPSLLRLHDGRIALLYLCKAEACRPLICFSDDEAKTFSDPQPISAPDAYQVVNNDRMIQLQSGRLVVPAAIHRMRGVSYPGESSAPEVRMAAGALIVFFLSDDGGAHWFESRNAVYATFDQGGLQEPGVVELKSGKLWAWARAETGNELKNACQWQTTSADAGLTWSAARRSDFISPASPMSVKRISATGDLLAIWNDHSGRFPVASRQNTWGPKNGWTRTPLVSAISRDEGKTWTHHRALESAPDDGFCYTAIHFVEDAVLLAYCAGGASSEIVLDTLRLRRMSLNELYKN